MAWVATAEGEQESKRSGCVVLRELPSRPTQRICKLSSELDAKSRASDLMSFSGSHDQQQKQLQAFSSAWEDVSTTLKDLRQHTLAPVAHQLQQWVTSNGPVQSSPGYGLSSSSSTGNVQMMAPQAAGILPCCSNQLPIIALSVATSTNTAATYAELLFTVKSKGHPVALVSARGASSGLSAMINSAMRSFLNEPTAADDIPALLAWWQDTCQNHAGPTGQAGKAQSSADGSIGDKPAVTPPGSSQAAAAATTPARELRARTPAKTPTKPGNAKQSRMVKQLGPPVLVLQDADSGDMEALEELVVALSEARVVGLPIVLVLGINITPSHLLQLLPNGVLRRAHLTALTLPPARTQVTQLYRALLLRGPQPLLALGPKISDWLLQHFRDVDCSAAMMERVLQLSCVEQFRRQPLSCLAAAAATGSRRAVAAAVKQLDQQDLLLCCNALLSHPAAATTSSADITSRSPGTAQPDRSATTASMASVQQLQQFVKQDSDRNSNAASTAAVAQVLQDSVWTAMQHYGKWRLGVLLLDMLARFTGAADVDASLQLPAIYTAASQPNFMTVKKKGNLSNCGKLLMKLLGDSSQGSSTRSRAGVTVVRALSGSECLQLVGKLVGLLQDAQLTQKQRQKQQRQQRQQAQLVQGAVAPNAPHDDDSSSSESDSESGLGSQVHRTAEDDAAHGHDGSVASCESVQQLQQALQELQIAAGAAEQRSQAHIADHSPMLDSVVNCQDHQHQEKHDLEQLERFAQRFEELLVPMPDLVETAAAAAVPFAGGSLISTPAGKGQCCAAAGSGQDAVTPGGLASLLRKQVRFAPDMPDHANGKHAGGSSSTRSTPSDVSAASPVPGLIKTPSKKGSRATQPKRLFAAAAAANAAAAAAKQPRRRKGDKKQAAEEGEVAGSSTAVLAAAVGLAQPSATTSAAAGNKRAQRLMQMMAASSPSPTAADVRKNSGSGRSSVTTRRAAGSAVGVGAVAGQSCSLTPPVSPSSDAAVEGSPDSPMLSDKVGGSCSSKRAALISAGARPSPGGNRTAGLATRTSSRLSKQSEPATEQQQQQVEEIVEEDLKTEQNENADPAGVDSMQEKPQREQHSEPALTAEPLLTCASMLAALLEAVIPKLLLEWSCPAASDSTKAEAAALGSAGSTPLVVAAAAAFVYDDLDMICSMLSPAPPCAVHAALVDPSQKLPGHPEKLQDGWEDTCLAYVLLQQQRDDSLAVSDWFGLFCQAQGLQGFRGNEGGFVGYSNDSDLDDSDAQQAPVGRAARNKARRGRKARGYADARESTAGQAVLSNGKSTGKKRAAASSSSKADTGDEVDVAVDEGELLSTAARFCQAAAELQILGVWKAAKKRRMAAVHRVFAPGGQLMAGAADFESLPDHDYE